MNISPALPALLTAGLCMAALAAPAGAAEKHPQTGFLFETLQDGGQAYPYVVYVPRNYDALKKWPLIVFLHGAGESGADGLKMVQVGVGSAIQLNEAEWPFIVIFPQKPNVQLAWEDIDKPVMEMLVRARKDYNVDGTRLYLTGLSQGGHGTWILGARHAALWAAVAPICGYADLRRETPPAGEKPFPASLEDIGKALKATPLWAFHGEADSVVPVAETKALVAAVKAAGGDPKMTLYPGVDHNSWDKAYRTEHLGDWFLAHKKG
jgi:predicted peptidase